MLFILSVVAQLISACGAAVMLLKKKKGTAGLFAVLGLFGAVLAGSVLKTVPDKTEKQIKNACDTLQKDIDDSREEALSEELVNDDTQSFSNAVDEAFSSINNDEQEFCEKEENDGNKTQSSPVQQNGKAELWRIENAINILKNAGAGSDAEFSDIDAGIDDEISKLQ